MANILTTSQSDSEIDLPASSSIEDQADSSELELREALQDAKCRIQAFFDSYSRLGERLLTKRKNRVERMSENRHKLNGDNEATLKHIERNSDRVSQVLEITLVLNIGQFQTAEQVHKALDGLSISPNKAQLRDAIREIQVLIPAEDLSSSIKEKPRGVSSSQPKLGRMPRPYETTL